MSRARAKRKPVERPEGPNSFRVRQSAGFYQIGDDKQGTQTWTMTDSPLERLRVQDKLSKAEYEGLMKYRIHWYHGGLLPSVGSADLNRVHASDPTNVSGMAKTETQVFHRQKYREASDMIGHRALIVIDNVVLYEHPIEFGGYALGWNNRSQASAAAIEVLRDAGYRLARHWGIG